MTRDRTDHLYVLLVGCQHKHEVTNFCALANLQPTRANIGATTISVRISMVDLFLERYARLLVLSGMLIVRNISWAAVVWHNSQNPAGPFNDIIRVAVLVIWGMCCVSLWPQAQHWSNR